MEDIKESIDSDWDSVTVENMGKYRASYHRICYLNRSLAADLKTYPAINNNHKFTAFKRGIKRDASLFNVLKHEKNWHSWAENTVATNHSQGLEDIINPTYLPVGGPAKDLFYEKQRYMY